MEKRDVIVVGKGLVGSAAAKYLSQYLNVAIIGPDEPENGEDAIVFASHYDNGRVQRLIGLNDAATMLNIEAAKSYDLLKQQSGVDFHGKVGCLYVNPDGEDPYLQKAKERAQRYGVYAKFYQGANELREAFPDFSFPETAYGMWEDAPSGYINPRLLVQAQLAVAQQNGGDVICDTVGEIEYLPNFVKVTTCSGKVYYADKIVLAAGAFTNFLKINGDKPDFVLKSETIILAQVTLAEAQRLQQLPSLLYEIDTPELQGVYSICPLQYPDGNYYLKLGANLPEDIFFDDDLQEIQTWFKYGDSDANINKMRTALEKIMPNLKIENCFSKRCIVTYTNHDNPYIGMIHPRACVVIGNGYSAMCSDAIGRVVSHLSSQNEFPQEYDSKDFAITLLHSHHRKVQ